MMMMLAMMIMRVGVQASRKLVMWYEEDGSNNRKSIFSSPGHIRSISEAYTDHLCGISGYNTGEWNTRGEPRVTFIPNMTKTF